MLRKSLSHYQQLHIIDCGSFYERLYFLLTLINETYSIPLSTNKTLLVFKTSLTHPYCVYVYNTKCSESPMKSYQFMLQQIEKYPPKVSFINGIIPDGSKTGPSFKGQSGMC